MRSADLFAVNAEIARRRPAALVTDLATGAQRFCRADSLAGDPLAPLLAERLQSGVSGLVEVEGRRLFIQIHAPSVRLVIVGAVHVAQALAPMARLAGFDVVLVDPRTAFASPERFPDARLIAQWPQDALAGLRLDASTAVVLLTHDPRIDDPALMAALAAGCFYIGALGSKKTHAQRIERLRLDADAQGRIHAPVGLDIGALTPAEIAVSVVAELVAARRHKPSRRQQAA